MASNKIKAEVRINDVNAKDDDYGITLGLTNAQATDVLEAVVSGEPLFINLVTTPNGDTPAAYAE